MDIKKLIGEATEYDKKEMLEYKKPKSWLKSVSAFANGMGGKLLFGIDDDGELSDLLITRRIVRLSVRQSRQRWILFQKFISCQRRLMERR